MLKALYTVLVALALLVAAMASGWSAAAPSGSSRFSGFSSFAGVSGLASQQRVTSHDPASFEDDDSDHDDDGDECSMVAPPRSADDADADADADGDANALQPSARARGIPPLIVAASSTTRWGLRPSGEHRHAADRPPRV
jgi:hypothetical protein